MAEPARKLEDESAQESIRPKFGVIQGGGEGGEAPLGRDLKSVGDSAEDNDQATGEGSSNVVDLAARREQQALGMEDQRASDASAANEEAAKVIPFTGSPKSQRITFRGRFLNRKTAIGGGITGLLAAGLFGILTFTSGPAQLIHFSQLLQRFHFSNDSSFMDNRAGKLIRHMRTVNTPERRNLGYFGNVLADRYELKMKRAGMTPEYSNDAGNRGRLDRIRVDMESPEGKVTVSKLRDAGISVSSDGLVDLHGTSARTRRFALTAMVDSIGLGKISSSMSTRMLSLRGKVNFHPRNLVYKGDEVFADWVKKMRGEHKEDLKEGVTEGDARRSPSENPDTGEIPSPDDAELLAEAGELGEEIKAKANTGVEVPEIKAEFKTQMKAKVGTAAGVVGAAALMCGLDKLGDEVPKLKHLNLVLPLIRKGMHAVVMGSKIQSGQDVSMEEIGVFSQDLYDPATGSSAFADASIQAELGEPITGPDSMAHAKPSTDKPAFFKVVDKVVDSIPGGSIGCSFLTSQIGGIAADGLDIITGILTGGASTAVAVAGVAAGYAGSALFMDDIVGWLIGEPVDLLARGAMNGAESNYGAALAARDVAATHGGIELSSSEVAALDADRELREHQELQGKSFYARYFDPSYSQSLAAITFFDSGLFGGTQNFISSVIKTPLSLFSRVGNILSPQAHAALPYNYGFPELGFTLEEIESDIYDDPYANAAYFESDATLLTRMNNDYGKPCFNLTIDPANGKINAGNDVLTIDALPDKCKDRGNVEFTRYRFYIADLITARSLACYELVDDTACNELGFGGAAQTTGNPTTATGGTVSLDGYKIDGIQLDTTAASCTGGLQAGAEVIGNFVKSRWGASYGGYSCRGKSTNGESLSIHAEGRAIDQSFNAFDTTELQKGNEVFGWLLANAQSIGVQYVKFWKLQWSPARGLRCVTDADDIENHSNHIHYELNWPAARKETPYFTTPTNNPPLVINQGLCP